MPRRQRSCHHRDRGQQRGSGRVRPYASQSRRSWREGGLRHVVDRGPEVQVLPAHVGDVVDAAARGGQVPVDEAGGTPLAGLGGVHRVAGVEVVVADDPLCPSGQPGVGGDVMELPYQDGDLSQRLGPCVPTAVPGSEGGPARQVVQDLAAEVVDAEEAGRPASPAARRGRAARARTRSAVRASCAPSCPRASPAARTRRAALRRPSCRAAFPGRRSPVAGRRRTPAA